MTYKEYRIKEIGSAISNIIGFVSAYILFYMLFAIPIDFSAIAIITGVFTLGFFGNSYLFHRMLSRKKRVFKDDVYDTVRIMIFLLCYMLFCYISGRQGCTIVTFCLSATGAILALLIKGLIINDSFYQKMRKYITPSQ